MLKCTAEYTEDQLFHRLVVNKSYSTKIMTPYLAVQKFKIIDILKTSCLLECLSVSKAFLLTSEAQEYIEYKIRFALIIIPSILSTFHYISEGYA